VIRVQRDDGTPLAMADARLGRSLVALDLAQAQADLLDHDEADAAAALRRVDAALTVQFDDGDAAVRAAHAHLGALLAALKPSPSLRLGGALAELRNLRAVHALQTEAAPAPAKPATGGTP
jgi:uroporphyrin-3 C-methyltransferase